jgi:hypothetical protein
LLRPISSDGRLLILIVISVLLALLAGPACALGQGHTNRLDYGPESGKKAAKRRLLEGRIAYFWGFHEIWIRDGDNAHIPPSKKEITLNSPLFGVYGETFLREDLALRVQGWMNIPFQHRNDFLFDGTALGWEVEARHIGVDIAAIYHLGLRKTPYMAGLVGGYRFNDFSYRSLRDIVPQGSFDDHLEIHIPYLGVYYAHVNFIGSVVRLDLHASPLTLCRYEGERNLQDAEPMRIKGHSVTGFWYETLFSWSIPAGRNSFVGLYAKYDYLELSGGATVSTLTSSTRFSMDSRHNLIRTGLIVTYTF